MAVILKKDEKIQNVINNLKEDYSEIDFIEKFKELYPDDWKKIENNYNQHLQKTRPGKPIPMPNPVQYLKNALNVWRKKIDN